MDVEQGPDPARPATTDAADGRSPGPWLRTAGDVGTVVFVGWLLFGLVAADGGRNTSRLFLPGVAALLLLPWAVEGARRLAPRSVVVVGVGTSGFAIALWAARSREDFVGESLTFVLAVVAGLLLVRLSERRWFRLAVFGLLLAGLAAYWRFAFLDWWSRTLGGNSAAWQPLSWRNQSGVLMGAFALVLAGTAMRMRGVVALGSSLGAGAALAGLWLSGSRGALASTAVGGVVTLAVVIARRGSGTSWRSLAVRGAGVFAVAAVIVVALTATLPDGAPTPLQARADDASTNLARRFEHMEAAWGLFLERPVTGHGPGSYGALAVAHTDPEGNLTFRAHNEWLEAFADGGLLLGVPVLAFGVAAALLVLAAARRPVDPAADDRALAGLDDGLPDGLTAGAAGAIVLLGLHAAIDFDWAYPILLTILVIGTIVLWADGHEAVPTRTSRTLAAATLLPLVIIGGLGLWASQADRPHPWDSFATLIRANEAVALGDLEAARADVDASLRWSPGDRRLRILEAVIAYRRGDTDAEELVALYEAGGTFPSALAVIPEALLRGGDREQALAIARDATLAASRYPLWGTHTTTLRAYRVLVAAAVDDGNCERATDEAEAARLALGLESTPSELEPLLAACVGS